MEIFGAIHSTVHSDRGTHPLENTDALRKLLNKKKVQGIALIKESRMCFIWLPLGKKVQFEDDALNDNDRKSTVKQSSRSIAKKIGSLFWKYKVSNRGSKIDLKASQETTATGSANVTDKKFEYKDEGKDAHERMCADNIHEMPLQQNNPEKCTDRMIDVDKSWRPGHIPKSEELGIQISSSMNVGSQTTYDNFVYVKDEELIPNDRSNDEKTQTSKPNTGNSIFYLEDCEEPSSLYDHPLSLTAQVADQGFPSLNDASYVRQVAKLFTADCFNSEATLNWTTPSKCRPSWAGYCAAMRYYPTLTTNCFFSMAEMNVLLENGMDIEEILNLKNGFSENDVQFCWQNKEEVVRGDRVFSQNIQCSKISLSVKQRDLEMSETKALFNDTTFKRGTQNSTENSRITRQNSFLERPLDSRLNQRIISTSVTLSRRHSFSERVASSFTIRRKLSAPETRRKTSMPSSDPARTIRKTSLPSSTNLKTGGKKSSYEVKLTRRGSFSQFGSIRTSRPVDWSCKSCPDAVPYPRLVCLADAESSAKPTVVTSGNYPRQRKLCSPNAVYLQRHNSVTFNRTPSFGTALAPKKLFRSFSFSEHLMRPSSFSSGNPPVSKSPESGDLQMTRASISPTSIEDLDHDTWLNMPEEEPPKPALKKQVKTVVRTVSRKMSLTPKPPEQVFTPGVPEHLRYQLKQIYVY